MKLEVAPVKPDELTLFSEALQEVARWLETTRQPLWTLEALEPEALLKKNGLDELFLGRLEGVPVATMILQHEDLPFWPDDPPGEALYLHKLAVRRSAGGGGVSVAMLAWAQNYAARLGKRYLRLDTSSGRPKLNALYRSHGFSYAGFCQVDGFDANLYELELPRP